MLFLQGNSDSAPTSGVVYAPSLESGPVTSKTRL